MSFLGLLIVFQFSQSAFASCQTDVALEIVEKLASTNSPSIIFGSDKAQKVRDGEIYDDDERKRVNAAVLDAIRKSESIWPQLVDHLGDDRFSKTVGIGAGYPRNWTVGDVCQNIIGQTLSEPYYRHVTRSSGLVGGGKAVFHKFQIPAVAKDKDKLREWCLDRKDKELFELQIELCEWAIAEVEASFDKKHQGTIKSIKKEILKEIDGLTKSKKPVPCTSSF